MPSRASIIAGRIPEPHRDPTSRSHPRHRGASLIEIMIVLTILVFVVGIFYRMLAASSRLQETNRENAIAAEAARIVIESMRNESFDEVYALYNRSPDDDPGGAGTAPGNRFAVQGLRPLASSPGGLQGEVIFPEKQVTIPAGPSPPGGATSLTTAPLGGALSGGSGPTWQLREDCQDEDLGMPRDLDGDNLIDDLDHSSDYSILPIEVRVEWEGRFGKRSLELFTMLVDFKVGKL